MGQSSSCNVTVVYPVLRDLRLFANRSTEADSQYLVYGASSSVGLYAIQLAKSISYRVVAICSPRNAELVKSYGADAVVDYSDVAKAKSELQRITGGGVTKGFDAISEGASFEIALGGFKAGEKGRLNAVLPPPPEAEKLNEDVEVVWTLAYELLGKTFRSVSGGPACTGWGRDVQIRRRDNRGRGAGEREIKGKEIRRRVTGDRIPRRRDTREREIRGRILMTMRKGGQY